MNRFLWGAISIPHFACLFPFSVPDSLRRRPIHIISMGTRKSLCLIALLNIKKNKRCFMIDWLEID